MTSKYLGAGIYEISIGGFTTELSEAEINEIKNHNFYTNSYENLTEKLEDAELKIDELELNFENLKSDFENLKSDFENFKEEVAYILSDKDKNFDLIYYEIGKLLER